MIGTGYATGVAGAGIAAESVAAPACVADVSPSRPACARGANSGRATGPAADTASAAGAVGSALGTAATGTSVCPGYTAAAARVAGPGSGGAAGPGNGVHGSASKCAAAAGAGAPMGPAAPVPVAVAAAAAATARSIPLAARRASSWAAMAAACAASLQGVPWASLKVAVRPHHAARRRYSGSTSTTHATVCATHSTAIPGSRVPSATTDVIQMPETVTWGRVPRRRGCQSACAILWRCSAVVGRPRGASWRQGHTGLCATAHASLSTSSLLISTPGSVVLNSCCSSRPPRRHLRAERQGVPHGGERPDVCRALTEV